MSIIQALIVFGANVNALNGKGETPRHLVAASRAVKRDLVLYTLHAVGAARCTDDVPNCQDGCSSFGCLDGIGPERPNFFKSAKRKCEAAYRRYRTGNSIRYELSAEFCSGYLDSIRQPARRVDRERSPREFGGGVSAEERTSVQSSGPRWRRHSWTDDHQDDAVPRTDRWTTVHPVLRLDSRHQHRRHSGSVSCQWYVVRT